MIGCGMSGCGGASTMTDSSVELLVSASELLDAGGGVGGGMMLLAVLDEDRVPARPPRDVERPRLVDWAALVDGCGCSSSVVLDDVSECVGGCFLGRPGPREVVDVVLAAGVEWLGINMH